MDENAIGEAILGCALKVHRGPGLLENAYETCLAIELQKAGLAFTRQPAMPVFYDGEKVELGYRLDLLIEDRVVVEVKAVDKIADIHRAQLLSYLKLGGFRLGYLLNFNVGLMKDGIVRMVHRL
jgi:GxxExxY protein